MCTVCSMICSVLSDMNNVQYYMFSDVYSVQYYLFSDVCSVPYYMLRVK